MPTITACDGSTITGSPQQFVRAVTPAIGSAIRDIQRQRGIPAEKRLGW
jgi:hypothetical protein